MSDWTDPVILPWVVARYKGEKAKNIINLASNGLGYLILQNYGKQDVLVAFRCAIEPLPPSVVEVIDPFKIADYDRRLKERMGLHNIPKETKKPSATAISTVIETRKDLL